MVLRRLGKQRQERNRSCAGGVGTANLMWISAWQHQEISLAQVISVVGGLDAGLAGKHRVKRCDRTGSLLNAPGLGHLQAAKDAAFLTQIG